MKAKMKTLLLAAAAGAMVTMSAGALAQAPGGGPPGGMGMGMGGMTPTRENTLQRNGLDDAALKLTAAQKTEIDKAADAYVAEMTAVNAKFPMAQGSPPSEEARAARTKARDNLTAAVNKVLNAEQKKTLEAAMAARPRGGMGGPGGPGGMGGPGGPPGGAPRPPGT